MVLPMRKFSGCGICQEIDVLDTLLQFVEGDETTLQQRARIDRRHDAARTAIQQLDPERYFHIGDSLRYGGLGHRELAGCLAHAAARGHRHQDMQVTKL